MLKIKTDSRKVIKGDTFVAIKGHTVDGHDYINKAIENGATRIVCEHGECPVETIVTPNPAQWLTETLVRDYSDEINELTLVGVTGTNGKTTTCFLVYQMLKKLGVKAAYMGTIGFYFEDIKEELPNTTPEIVDVYNYILRAKELGATHFIMEVSSHALSFDRVAGLKYTTEAFTNLTEDHLDYHKTMENYLHAKLHILDYLKNDGVIVVNKDDMYSKYFQAKNNITIGFGDCDFKALSYTENSTGMDIAFIYENTSYVAHTNLKSRFNVYNYLTCLAICKSLGFAINDLIDASLSIYPPHGRCESIKVGKGQAVIDYAHTPDAVSKIIDAFLENKTGKIITIVGCGGDRDPMKRPIMGDIATKKSDYVIFTNDNPRTEDPEVIMKDILNGVESDNYCVIYDRKEAILKGLAMLEDNDTLLILGKGHEDYQIMGHTKHHFDDTEVVLEYIKTQA